MAEQFIDFTEKENVFPSFGIQVRQGVTYVTLGFDSGDGQQVYIEMNALHFREFQKGLDNFITMIPISKENRTVAEKVDAKVGRTPV